MTAEIENSNKNTDKKGTLKAALLYKNAAVDELDEMMNIRGNGMEPIYYDGDRVLVKYCDTIAEGEVGAYENIFNAAVSQAVEYRRRVHPKFCVNLQTGV